jgi:hypothetical protein
MMAHKHWLTGFIDLAYWFHFRLANSIHLANPPTHPPLWLNTGKTTVQNESRRKQQSQPVQFPIGQTQSRLFKAPVVRENSPVGIVPDWLKEKPTGRMPTVRETSPII